MGYCAIKKLMHLVWQLCHISIQAGDPAVPSIATTYTQNLDMDKQDSWIKCLRCKYYKTARLLNVKIPSPTISRSFILHRSVLHLQGALCCLHKYFLFPSLCAQEFCLTKILFVMHIMFYCLPADFRSAYERCS